MPREKEEVGWEGGPPGCTTLHTHIEPNQMMTFDNSFRELKKFQVAERQRLVSI